MALILLIILLLILFIVSNDNGTKSVSKVNDANLSSQTCCPSETNIVKTIEENRVVDAPSSIKPKIVKSYDSDIDDDNRVISRNDVCCSQDIDKTEVSSGDTKTVPPTQQLDTSQVLDSDIFPRKHDPIDDIKSGSGKSLSKSNLKPLTFSTLELSPHTSPGTIPSIDFPEVKSTTKSNQESLTFRSKLESPHTDQRTPELISTDLSTSHPLQRLESELSKLSSQILDELTMEKKTIGDIAKTKEDLLRVVDERITVHLEKFRKEFVDNNLRIKSSLNLAKPRRPLILKIGSLNCGGNLKLSEPSKWVLDNRNTQLYGISHLDFCSIQELIVPNVRWDSPKPGALERFGCVRQQRAHNLFLSSVANVEVNHVKCQKSFGIYVNPNLNFIHTTLNGDPIQASNVKIDNYVSRVDAKKNKGVIFVRGKLFDRFDAVIGSIHGLFEGSDAKLAYDNPINKNLVTDALKFVRELKRSPDVFVLIGDFNMRTSCFQRYLLDEWKLLWNSLQSEIDFCVHGDGLVTCFDKDGFAQPDHIITNQTILDFSVAHSFETDHMYVSVDLELEIKEQRDGNVKVESVGHTEDTDNDEQLRVKRKRAINVSGVIA